MCRIVLRLPLAAFLFLLGALTALYNVIMTIRMPAIGMAPEAKGDLPAEPAMQAGE